MTFLKRLILIKLFIIYSMSVTAGGIKLDKLDFNGNAGDEFEFSISMEKGFRGIPQLEVKKNILQVTIPESYVWPKIEKQVTINKKFDTKLIAYQFNKDLVRFRAILPNSLEGKENLISLTMEGDKINVKMPKKLFGIKRGMKAKRKISSKKQDVSKYDESYLKKLFKDKMTADSKPIAIPKIESSKAKTPNLFTDMSKTKTTKKESNIEDKVVLKESSLKEKSEFSVTSYIGKFVAFLGLILMGFYFIVTLMKKGVLKKGKLGFLNSTKLVEVLNTTYIGPKRTISVIKAHNQVFLIGNSEKGIHFLSEINDVAGLLKTGELDIAGSNFDTNFSSEKTTEQQFNLKEVLTDSAKIEDEQRPSVKNQITAKLRNLKSLQ